MNIKAITELTEANRMSSQEKYWVAINGASVAMAPLPMNNPIVSPRPESIIGFPTREEALAAQRFLLTAAIPAVRKRLVDWQCRNDIRIIVNKNPEKPTRGPTLWVEQREEVTNG